MNHIVTLLSLLLFLFDLGTSKPRVIPTDRVVLAGESIVLNCSGTNLNWRYYPPDHGSNPHSDKDIYINGKLRNEFALKGFRIDGDQTLDEVNLYIENVTVHMAGKYECIENDNDHKSAQLIVLEKIPVWQVTSVSGARTDRITFNSLQDGSLGQHGFIGPNTCNKFIPPDQITISCSLTYFGNDTPVLELRNLKENKLIEPFCSKTDVEANRSLKRLTCNATMEADLDLDGAQFICQINQSAQKQYNSTTEPIKIQYSFHGNPSNHEIVQLGDEVNCTANCSQPRGYNWTWSEKTNEGVLTNIIEPTQILKAKRSGSHRCDAKCQIGKHSCTVNVMYAEVSSSTLRIGGEQQTAQWKLPIGIITIVLVAGFVTLVVLLILRRRSRNQTQTDDDENQPEAQSLQMSHVQEMTVEPQCHET